MSIIRNQNVYVQYQNDGLKVVNLQNHSTPGIKLSLDLKVGNTINKFFIYTGGYKITKKTNTNVGIYIYGKLCGYLGDAIGFFPKVGRKIEISILFSNSSPNDIFLLKNINIANNNVIIYSLSFVNNIAPTPEADRNGDITPENDIQNESVIECEMGNNIPPIPLHESPDENDTPVFRESFCENDTPREAILIIVDYVFMKNNIAESRYKFIDYLASTNDDIIVVGTGMKFFRAGMSIFTLVDLLKIRPRLIIHANNFLKSRLLVSNLREYRQCPKALIIEDMHSGDLITRLARTNQIDYILYHCDCFQLDRIRLMNRQAQFIYYPHYIDTTIYRDYGERKIYDIILYGCVDKSVYPFRFRLFNLIRKCGRFKVMYIPFPGYIVKDRRSVISGAKLAKLIGQSYIGISTTSMFDYFLKKYLEIPACRTMVAGNIPTRYTGIFRGNMIELTQNMRDDQIIYILTTALADKKFLMEKTDSLYQTISEKYSFTNGNTNFRQFIDSVASRPGAYICQ